MNTLDRRDQEILAECMKAREAIAGPRMGDYVLFPTGELERFSHNWGDELQTSPSGSFFLHASGEGGFSGGLNPSTPANKLSLMISKTLPGTFWFFHHGFAGAGRGVYFEIPCRVYTTTAEYGGFLGKDFISERTAGLKRMLVAGT